jgi:hypothetical protein
MLLEENDANHGHTPQVAGCTVLTFLSKKNLQPSAGITPKTRSRLPLKMTTRAGTISPSMCSSQALA